MSEGPWSNQVRALLIVAGPGAGSGVFVYDPSPGAANLIAAITDAAKDPFGNATPGSGVSTYINGLSTSAAARLTGDQLLFYTGPHNLTGPWTLVSGIDSASVGLELGQGVSGSGVRFVDPVQAPVTAIQPGTTATPETWHNITLDAGWSTSSQAAQYRMLPDGNVQTRGQITHASVTAVTQINGSNPIDANYRPAATRFYRASDPMDTAGLVSVDTAGVFSVRANASFPATQALMDGIYSL